MYFNACALYLAASVDSLTSLVWWCRALGVKVTFFDILDRERVRSPFSWEALRLFLARLLTQGNEITCVFHVFAPLSTSLLSHCSLLTCHIPSLHLIFPISLSHYHCPYITPITLGVALLPHAVVVGNTEFVFRDTSQIAQSNPTNASQTSQSNPAPRYLLTSSVEKLSLVRAIDR